MRYQYDSYGWFVKSIDTETVLPFTSSIEPPEAVDNLRANYIGNEWVLEEYIPPIAIVTILPPVFPNPTEKLIDKGPFYDRFGASVKIAILTSTDPGVRSILTDLNIREYVDLARADVYGGLKYIQSIIPALTDELINNILTSKVLPSENFALRTKFFS